MRIKSDSARQKRSVTAYNIAAKSLGEKHPITLDMKATLNGFVMKLALPAVN